MPETLGNVEIASAIHEAKQHRKNKHDREALLEILEAVLLAVIAVATAWSGYQAARWDGHSALEFARGLATEIEARELTDLGELDLLHDVSTFNTWLEAKTDGNEKLASLSEQRFSDEYEAAFKAWLRTEPLTNPNAPTGPAYMPEYRNHRKIKGDELHEKGTELLEAGRLARETGEDYTRLTVILALALFLTAISQKFHFKIAKLGLLSFAGLIVLTTIVLMITYPMM